MASAEFVLPEQLTRKLGRLQAQVKRLAVMKGLCVFCLVAIGTIAAVILADLNFDFSEGTRAVALAAVSIVAVITFWRFVLRPALTNMSSAELAAMVEITHPELNEQLTSTIELNDPDVPESHKGSALMRDLLTEQTLNRVGNLDFSQSVTAVRTFRMTVLAALAIMVFLLPYTLAPDSYQLLLSRLFLPFGNYATVGSLVFEVEPGDQIVARGDDVTLTATVAKRLGGESRPETVWLNWTSTSGEIEQRRMEFHESAEAFQTTLPAIVSDFDFHISADSSRSRFYRVTVVERPELTAATLDIEPPAYVGLPARTIDGIIGDIHVHERSGLSYRLKFNKPIAKAELHWLQPQRIPLTEAELSGQEQLPASVAFDMSDDGTTATLKSAALVSGPFTLSLTDSYGLTNRDDPRRNLVVTVDRPPELILEGDTRPQQVRPDDVVPIRVRANDDFGIGALELHYSILTVEQKTAVESVGPATLGQQEIDHSFRLDLSKLELQNGMVISYRVRVADQRPIPGPNEVWSEERLLNISDSAKPPGSEELAKRQRELKQELQSIREGVEKNSKQVAELHNDAESDLRMQLEFSRNKEIAPRALEEIELAEQLESLSSRFAEHRLYSNLVPEAREIARQELPQTSQKLRKAADAALRQKADTLSASVGRLDRIADNLREMEKEFDELAALESDLLELNRLAERAKTLSEQAIELDRRRRDVPDNETAEQREQREQQLAQEMRQLAARQQQLTNQLQDLLERRPELVEAARADQLDRLAELSKRALELAEPQDMLAEALRKESQRATIQVLPLPDQQKTLNQAANELAAAADTQSANAPVTPLDPQALRKALDALNNGDDKEAQKQQQAAVEELERLAAELRKNGLLPTDPQKAVEELAKRQRELQQRASDAAKNSPAADASDEQKQQFQQQMRNLAAEQAALQVGTARMELPSRNREQQQQTVKQAAETVGEFLQADAKQAAEAARLSGEQMERLANEIGDADQRREAAKQQVAELRKQQQEISRQVDGTIDAARRNRRSKPEEQLQTLAKQQTKLARQLADLDAPAAATEQRDAVRKSAQALIDLEQGRTADAQGSQAKAQQALAWLQQKLAGETSLDDQIAELRKQQQALGNQALQLAENSDRPRLAQAAEQQDQLGEQIAKLDVPAAKAQQQAAVDAVEAAASEMRELGSGSEDIKEAIRRSDEALQQLAKAGTPQQSSPAEVAEQLVKQQKQSEQEAQRQSADKKAPSAAQRQQAANQLARTTEAAQQLRAGAAAAEEKQTAMKELAEAAEAQEQVNDLVERLERRKQTPQQIAKNERLQRMMNQNVDAQGDAADALEQLRQTLSGQDARQQSGQNQQQLAAKTDELNQQNSRQSSPAEVAKAAEQLANEQAQVRQQTEQLAQQPNRPEETPQPLQKRQEQLQQRAEQLPTDVAALPRAEAVQHLEQAEQALEQGNLNEATQQQQQAEQALRDVQQQAQAMAQSNPTQPNNQPPAANSPSNTQLAEQAAELAQQQRELQQQLAQTQNPGEPETNGQPNAQNPPNSENPNQNAQPNSNSSQPANSGPPPSAAETVSAQQELMRDAAQLALDVARQTGADSKASQEASKMVRLSGG